MSSDEYKKYERACAKIKEENAKLLADFQQWLTEKGLAPKTIKEHAQNVDFYINTFLLYEDAIPAKDGAGHISIFLGDWFVRKALWASATSIRESAASLKKFYTFMGEKGKISADELQELKETIKEEMADWLANLEDSDNSGNDPLARWGL
jgi:site-specific recombinase XerD